MRDRKMIAEPEPYAAGSDIPPGIGRWPDYEREGMIVG